MISELVSFFHEKAILIIDDDYTSALLLSEYLYDLNAIIITADSCQKATDIFLRNPEIALVLMDIRLTDGCGIELTKSMKKDRPDVIIIAQSALIIDESMRDLNNTNFDSFLSKPISQTELVKTIYAEVINSKSNK
ncbi:MAG: hypothetical protein CVT95_13720 [Bacteroidetes bacterium HGW-Bacteroidetes-12]|nr:MAG: hypothetical protein CVT95_13720 [Bacteroidetes bacterium HGW-Bacteroidetes-12]